ncbi:hypothetical protein BDR26DRAFT_871546 [Obelidium mucronatum]|nr:hypothetical protein BDR26DRAFT_871546 [Obelidium mucronatum]
MDVTRAELVPIEFTDLWNPDGWIYDTHGTLDCKEFNSTVSCYAALFQAHDNVNYAVYLLENNRIPVGSIEYGKKTRVSRNALAGYHMDMYEMGGSSYSPNKDKSISIYNPNSPKYLMGRRVLLDGWKSSYLAHGVIGWSHVMKPDQLETVQKMNFTKAHVKEDGVAIFGRFTNVTGSILVSRHRFAKDPLTISVNLTGLAPNSVVKVGVQTFGIANKREWMALRVSDEATCASTLATFHVNSKGNIQCMVSLSTSLVHVQSLFGKSLVLMDASVDNCVGSQILGAGIVAIQDRSVSLRQKDVCVGYETLYATNHEAILQIMSENGVNLVRVVVLLTFIWVWLKRYAIRHRYLRFVGISRFEEKGDSAA